MKGKGKIYRPCLRCGVEVNFISWVEERYRGNIWHWANRDGSHHSCELDSPEKQHMRSIQQEVA